MSQLLTAQRIAEYAGIERPHKVTERLRKNGVLPADEVSTGGRRAGLYSVADVLRVYPYLAPLISAEAQPARPTERQERADKGGARRVPQEFERGFVNQVRDTYESQAIQANVRLCTEHVARQWFGDGRGPEYFKDAQAMASYFYKNRIMNPAPGRMGYFQAEGWKIAHEAKFRKRNRTHKTLPTVRYDYIQIGLSAGVLAPGGGAATVFVIDDRSGDSFVSNGKKKGFNGSLPNAIYCFCGWTGKLLAIQETEHVRSRDIALCILKAALRYGVPDVVVLENSAAMKSQQLTKVVESLYSDSALAVYKQGGAPWYKELFGGQCSPIVRNIPLIPRYPFKARAERLFRTFKEEHDAVYFPMSYQGGNRDESVQLTVSTMPVRVNDSHTPETYYASVWRYAGGLYMERNRQKMFPSFYTTTGLHPTIKNVWDAFGGDANAGTHRTPAPEKMALVLYWLADDKGNGLPKGKAKAAYGRVDVTFDGVPHYYRSADLDHQYEGRRVAVVPVPAALFGLGDDWDTSEYAAIFNIDNPEKPAFICIAKNVRTTDYRDVKENRDYVKATRKGLKKRLADADTRGREVETRPEAMEYEDEEVARLMRL